MELAKAVRVENDTAERAVNLFHDYNEVLSIIEKEKQYTCLPCITLAIIQMLIRIL